MRVNESVSPLGDYMKWIDYWQVFGIFDPEWVLQFNGGIENILQAPDINIKTQDTGIPEWFLTYFDLNCHLLKLHDFQPLLVSLKINCKHFILNLLFIPLQQGQRGRRGGRRGGRDGTKAPRTVSGQTRVSLAEHDMSGMSAMFFLPPTPF